MIEGGQLFVRQGGNECLGTKAQVGKEIDQYLSSLRGNGDTHTSAILLIRSLLDQISFQQTTHDFCAGCFFHGIEVVQLCLGHALTVHQADQIGIFVFGL